MLQPRRTSPSECSASCKASSLFNAYHVITSIPLAMLVGCALVRLLEIIGGVGFEEDISEGGFNVFPGSPAV